MKTDVAFLVLNLVGGFLLAFALVRFVATIKAFGGIRSCPFFRTLRLSVRGVKGIRIALFVPAMLATVILHQMSPGAFLPMPLWFGIGLIGFALSTSIIPPCVLIMGSSSPTTLGFAVAVSDRFLPLRSVHLLKTDGVGEATSNELWDSGNRVFTDWQRAVCDAVEFMPCIVMDVRGYTRAVHFELNHLFETDAYRRTVFIVDTVESLSTLLKMSPSAPSRGGLCVMNASPFVRAMTRFGWDVFRRESGSLFTHIRRAL